MLGQGFALVLIEDTLIPLTCPLLEIIPRYLGEVAAQAIDIGSKTCAIEPLEPEGHIFALGTQDVWWNRSGAVRFQKGLGRVRS